MKTKRKGHFFISYFHGLQILFRARPAGMVVYILGSAVHGLSWALEILCMQRFFDIIYQTAAGEALMEQAFLWLALLGLSYVFSQFMNGAFNCYGQILNKKLTRSVNELLFDRVNAMELRDFERVEELERLERAVKGGEVLFWVCTTILDLIFYYGVYFAFVGGYMILQEPMLGCAILLIFLPCLLSKAADYFIFQEKEEEAAAVRRHAGYYERCLTDPEYFKETRLLGAGRRFYALYTDMLKSLGRLEWRAKKRKSAVELALSTVTVVCYCMILYMLFAFVMNGSITVGVFAAILGSLSRMYSNMDEIISERIGWASENGAAVDNFIRFVEEPAGEKRKAEIGDFQNITLKEVSFTYPGAAAPAVDGISLSLKKGETLAVVGENGSGKTTLCRLLMGLYTPDTGSVSFDGVSSEQIQFTGISAVFQNFCRYQMKVRENVEISEPEKKRLTKDSAEDSALLGNGLAGLCRWAGIALERETYPDGLETMLGRDFGGTELSGGQWQRLSMARGLYRNHRLIVLDEPTAALDPLEETRVYRQLREMCREKTAVIVTHRIASSRIADRIVVLKDGKIVQEGSFAELSEKEGEYRRMYLEQGKWYTDMEGNLPCRR